MTDWLVMFGSADHSHWWDRFTGTGFRHVLAAQYAAGAGRWLLINPTYRRLRIHLTTPDALDALAERCIGADGRILRVPQPAAPPPPRPPLRPATCAVVIERVLGRRYGCITPRGLYDRLMAEPEVRQIHGQPVQDPQQGAGGATARRHRRRPRRA